MDSDHTARKNGIDRLEKELSGNDHKVDHPLLVQLASFALDQATTAICSGSRRPLRSRPIAVH